MSESIPSPADVVAQIHANRDAIQNTDKAIADLRAAVRASGERAVMQGAVAPTAAESHLSEYIDGERVRFFGRTERVGGGDGLETEYLPGLLDWQEPVAGDWHKDLRSAVTQRALCKMINPRASTRSVDRKIGRLLAAAPAPLQNTKAVRDARDGQYQRIFADSTGIGAEWIPDNWAPELDRYVASPTLVEALFPQTAVTSKVTYFPRLAAGFRPYLKNGATDDNPAQYTPSTATTSNEAYTVPSWAIRVVQDEDAMSDSIIADSEWLLQTIAAAINEGFEDALINGDTTATHQDTIAAWNIRSRWGASGLGTANDHRRAFIGLRARAEDISNTTNASAALTYALICQYASTLTAPLSSGPNKVLIVSPEVYVKHLLPIEQVATIDKFGPGATVVSGQLARIADMPVVVSDFLSADMNASGIYDDTTKTKTGWLIASTNRFHRIVRKGAMLESDKDVTRGIVHTVLTARKGFRPRAGTTDTSEKNVWFGYNVTP